MSEPARSQLETFCAASEQYQASDILLHEGRVPQLRIDGSLTPLEVPPLDSGFFDGLWKSCGASPTDRDFDTSFTSETGVRFRVNLLQQLGRRAAVLRRIRADIPDLESLGAPAALLHGWCGRKAGMVLVCGPTGSGKSTTIAAAIEWMNNSFSRHVVTIEDPIEYLFTPRMCLFTQREVGIDTSSFAEGLRRSLRQDPDVIFVGEIRDAVTALTAIQASETGHLVFATLHAANSVDTIERLQLLFPADERDAIRKTLSSQLIGVICQRLLPAATGGVALAAEYFSNVGAIRRFINDGKLPEVADAIRRADPSECRDFLGTLGDLVRSGRLTEETATAAADNPQELLRALRGISSSSQTARR